jgi:hypothetical protein
MLDRGGWSLPCPGCFTPRKDPVPLRLGGPQGWSGRAWKILSPPGFNPRTVQPVASRYPGPQLYFIDICKFYQYKVNIVPGSILAVASSNPHAPEKSSRFVGICIQRGGCGLRAFFILRNVIDNQGR